MVIPYYDDDWLTVYHGDARTVMAAMEPESVHCVVTSPPYWGLRDYGEPGQLGLEPTPEAYVESMVAVFREVRRVLRADGTVWLNLGDTFAAGGKGGGGSFMAERKDAAWQSRSSVNGWRPPPAGLKPKDLVGIPWRVAFALQADGWYLRSDIIWSKPNPMPESITDRPTKSHEYLFLLSKSARYYFDADAVREAYSPASEERYAYAFGGDGYKSPTKNPAARPDGVIAQNPAGRNIRSVWTVATQPYPGAHFATFPPKLIEPCIKAGTSERGVCPDCGAPWERETDGATYYDGQLVGSDSQRKYGAREYGRGPKNNLGASIGATTGWQPTCAHRVRCPEPCPRTGGVLPAHVTDEDHTIGYPMPVPATVLDPFAGSGTTGMVAQSLSRRAVLIDLSMDYLGQLMDRNRDIPLGLGA